MQDLVHYSVGALLAAVAVGGAMAAGAWGRRRGRFALAAVATFISWVIWRIVLRLSNGENLDVDNPVLLGLSAQDVGSGVLAFLFTALPLGLVTERREAAQPPGRRRTVSRWLRRPRERLQHRV